MGIDMQEKIEYNTDDRYWDEALSPHNWIVILTRPPFNYGGLFRCVNYFSIKKSSNSTITTLLSFISFKKYKNN